MAKTAANRIDVAFIPAISPGYNDRAVREGHPARGRYLEDDPHSKEGDLLRAMIRQIALPLADTRAEQMVMITSFNEWYEDTQIEPTGGTARVTHEDDSSSGREFTQGYHYEDYGSLYLQILRNGTQ